MTGLDTYLEPVPIADDGPSRLIDVSKEPIRGVLNILLSDKTTKGNIVWGTDAYADRGHQPSDQITMDSFFSGLPVELVPRIEKDLRVQTNRTRRNAEVFTPVWICNLMNNHCDEMWFGRKDVFNSMSETHECTFTEGKISFPEGRTWKGYVDSRRLEITCGEAPFLVSRYDASHGGAVLPLNERIGVFDRKMRIVNENASDDAEWLDWAIRALQSCYGYEFQGDNLLIARINVLLSFCDYYSERFQKKPAVDLLRKVSNIIAWNIWQMDGLQNNVLYSKSPATQCNLSMFDNGQITETKAENTSFFSKIYDWRRDNSVIFDKCRKRGKMDKKLFDYVIGNPPYQGVNDNNGRKPPIYHKFMDAAYQVGTAVELITPGRFLFNAGQTPKDWNQKILNDEHFCVIHYDPDPNNIFPNQEIKGGVAIHYRDSTKILGPIELFTPYDELRSVLSKVKVVDGDFIPMETIVSSQGYCHYSKEFFEDNADAITLIGEGTGSKITSSAIDKMPAIFKQNKEDENEVKILSWSRGERKYSFVLRKYIESNDYIDSYNVLIAESNGSGAFETLVTPIIAHPSETSADSYLSIGMFDNQNEADSLIKYLKTKFSRALLGIKKVTQHNGKSTWTYVPVQDFTDKSDIDWSKPIREIDDQLYRKYGLTNDEIQFIDSHVQEMV